MKEFDKYKQKRKTKWFLILICLATLFMSIGYAAINSITLDLEGTIIAKHQDGIFITDAVYKNNVNADYYSSEILQMYQSNLKSRVVLSNAAANSSITYEITIYNSKYEDYAFDEVSYLVTDDTYSNEDITFKLSGLAHGDILRSKQSVTFTITFYYKNNVLPGNNVLNSTLNFNFEKVYYITYENFSSTSSYPTYVLEGEDLSVSFGTLDAPIEVKKSNVILSSSEYSYSKYVLTMGNINGDIHIRKLTKYTITNLVKNGSFENGLNNWTIVGSSTSWHSTNIYHFGSKAYYRDASAFGINYIKQSLSFVNGHKYYFFAYTICTTEQQLYADIATKSDAINVKAVPTEYRKGSIVYTSTFTGKNNIHVNFANTTDSVIVDGIGMVDLTACFGSGNEPSKSWCDSNIKYFDNTTTVYK